jgi:glutathione S-transferase
MLKLYYTPGACSMVPHIALEEAGAQYEKVLIDFRTGDQLRPEFLKVNPKARVPVLLTDRGVLTEIPAILGYIAFTYPAARLAEIHDPFAFAQMQAFQAQRYGGFMAVAGIQELHTSGNVAGCIIPPRNVTIFAPGSRRNSGISPRNSSMAIVSSRRASGAPTQRCGPCPKVI